MNRRSRSPLRPRIVEEIQRDLPAHFPTLHLFLARDSAEVRGAFPVLGEAGRVLDRFQVRIALPPGYPRVLPIVRETNGRIPWIPDRHVNGDGTACVLLPHERSRVFPIDAPFLEFLRGPLHSFFLGQIAVERGESWPFGEWAHGMDGIVEYYRDLLGVSHLEAVLRYLAELKLPSLNPNRACPCGSGNPIRDCCQSRLQTLRAQIGRTAASAAYHQLAQHAQRLAQRQRPPQPKSSGFMLFQVSGSDRGLSDSSRA